MAKRFITFKKNNKLAISNDKLKTHFASHFAERKMPTPPELERTQDFPFQDDDVIHIDESVRKEKEIEAVLKSFKNNKSARTDKLKTEGLKYNNSKNLTTAIMILLTMIRTTIQYQLHGYIQISHACTKKGHKSLQQITEGYP